MKNKDHAHICKRWIIATVSVLLAALVLYAAVTVYIDPLFSFSRAAGFSAIPH